MKARATIPQKHAWLLILWAALQWVALNVGFAQVKGSSSQAYSNVVTERFVARSAETSRILVQFGFIPAESLSNVIVTLEGQSVYPSGRVQLDRGEYGFRRGTLQEIRRMDFFVDLGPESLILRHLTNTVLTLTTNAAAGRALDMLRLLGLDEEHLRSAYRIQVRDDLMTGHPIRNGGANFPKELRFFGELISRKKIKIMVDFIPADPKALTNSQYDGKMSIEFLATTGELLSARFTDPEAFARLGFPSISRITIEGASDFTPPVFFSATTRFRAGNGIISNSDVASLVLDTWNLLREKLGTNRPLCYLVCDNLSAPHLVSQELARLTSGTQWAGVSRTWRQDLPFEREHLDRLTIDKRGLSLLAVCGNVETRLAALLNLDDGTMPPERDPQSERYQRERKRWVPQVTTWLERLSLPADYPDHLVCLMAANANWISVMNSTELESQLRDRAQIYRFIGASEHQPGGEGINYLNGRVLTNALLALRISGFLPLQWDTVSLMRRRPASRIISGETPTPVRDLLYRFGPHPLQEVFDRVGHRGIELLRKAERVEVFRIKSNTPDDWSVAGRREIEGHEIIAGAKERKHDYANRLASTLVNEKNGFGFMKMCIWSPGVAFRLWHGKESATILVCFDCNDLVIKFYDSSGTVFHSSGFDFSGNQPALLRLAQEAFPSDPDLRKLSR